MRKNSNLAYIVGLSIGDGNLSNPNGRAVRLRISCDIKYPDLIKRIVSSLEKAFPNNKVSLIKRKDNCTDVSCYSNQFEELLGWKAGLGSKFNQKIKVPDWIFEKEIYVIKCLKGLIETDGSIYVDRGYKMVNFTTIIPTIKSDVEKMMKIVGFKPNTQTKSYNYNKPSKFTVRISKNTEQFLNTIKAQKA